MNLTRKTYSTRQDKLRDFIIGFAGWWGLNIVLGILETALSAIATSLSATSPTPNDTVTTIIGIVSVIIGCVPWLINLALLIYFLLTRQWIALGGLAAFGVAFLLALCIGVIVAVVCFGALGALGTR